MTDSTSIDLALGGVAMPFLIAAINQRGWDPKLKGTVAFLACLGAAAILAAIHGTLTLENWRDTAIVVTGASMVMYHALWKPSGLAPAVEDKTSVSHDTSTDDPGAL
jgi:peptidoglycan/LPS O-acetylase OafA/YrhL